MIVCVRLTFDTGKAFLQRLQKCSCFIGTPMAVVENTVCPPFTEKILASHSLEVRTSEGKGRYLGLKTILG